MKKGKIKIERRKGKKNWERERESLHEEEE